MGTTHRIVLWCVVGEVEEKVFGSRDRRKCQKHREERKVLVETTSLLLEADL